MEFRFHGGAGEVGGSCIEVRSRGIRVALDYGIKIEDEVRFDKLPEKLDAVIISHAHLDHSGGLFNLAKSKTVIVGSEATRDVAVELLYDMARIQRMKRNGFLFGRRDVTRLKRRWWAREAVALPGMEIKLYPAGHVLGAKMIGVKAEGKNVLYTGDFCLHDSEIMEGADVTRLPKEPDVLIMESTYGGKVRPDRRDLVKRLIGEVLAATERNGNVLIPVFAFNRLQEMAKRLDQAMMDGSLPYYNSYLISSLASKITRHFTRHKNLLKEDLRSQSAPFAYRHLSRIKSLERIEEPAIVICTPGFAHAGCSRRLLTEWMVNEANSVIVSSGYLPPESPLKVAMEKGELIEDEGKLVMRASMEQVELSGHADQRELVKLVKTLKPKKVFLVHGEPDQIQILAENIDGLTEVVVPRNGDRFTI